MGGQEPSPQGPEGWTDRNPLSPLIASLRVDDMKTIHIDKYDAVIENGDITYYAVKGKTRYPMPSAYSEMYNDSYLAIAEREMEMPELFSVPAKHFIPLRTSNA